jgi:hypothetical protein
MAAGLSHKETLMTKETKVRSVRSTMFGALAALSLALGNVAIAQAATNSADAPILFVQVSDNLSDIVLIDTAVSGSCSHAASGKLQVKLQGENHDDYLSLSMAGFLSGRRALVSYDSATCVVTSLRLH